MKVLDSGLFLMSLVFIANQLSGKDESVAEREGCYRLLCVLNGRQRVLDLRRYSHCATRRVAARSLVNDLWAVFVKSGGCRSAPVQGVRCH